MKMDLADLRHARSRKDFPELTLEKDEYVELAVSRSKVGLVLIWGGVIIGILAVTIVVLLASAVDMDDNLLFKASGSAKRYFNLLFFALYAMLIIIGLVGSKVYRGNKLFVTNHRVVQISTLSLFSQSTNVINLVSIEDVSYKQSGIFEYIFKIGTIRMSTVGDETTYTFPYVDTPTDELDTITHLVHVAKGADKQSGAKA